MKKPEKKYSGQRNGFLLKNRNKWLHSTPWKFRSSYSHGLGVLKKECFMRCFAAWSLWQFFQNDYKQ